MQTPVLPLHNRCVLFLWNNHTWSKKYLAQILLLDNSLIGLFKKECLHIFGLPQSLTSEDRWKYAIDNKKHLIFYFDENKLSRIKYVDKKNKILKNTNTKMTNFITDKLSLVK